MNEAVARLAASQDGVITRRQALDLGMSDEVLEARVKAGKWRRLHRGVYATFSGPLGRSSRFWAAVLRCGRGATLSHESAAEVLGLFTPDSWGKIHVTVPADRDIDEPPGIRLHYSTRLDRARHPAKRPPCTRIEETVVDLTQTAPSLDQAAGVIAEAVRQRLTTHERILAVIDSRHALRWRAELTECCGFVASGAHSLLELRYVRNVERAHSLPTPLRQARAKLDGRGIWIDARYPEYRTRIELDGQRGHTGDGVFRDLRRDNWATASGEDTLRFGWDDVGRRSCECAGLVAHVLAQNGWRGHLTPCPACQS